MGLNLSGSCSDILRAKIEPCVRDYYEQYNTALMNYFGSVDAIDAAALFDRAQHVVQGYEWWFVIDGQVVASMDAEKIAFPYS